MRAVRSEDGEMVDEIARRELGDAAHAPALLAANPNLAGLGPRLPAGILVALPEMAPPVERATLRLWGAPG